MITGDYVISSDRNDSQHYAVQPDSNARAARGDGGGTRQAPRLLHDRKKTRVRAGRLLVAEWGGLRLAQPKRCPLVLEVHPGVLLTQSIC